MLADRKGDVEQFGRLFDRHHQRLFEFFYRLTGDGAASEDLVQEVFLRMLKYRRSFGTESEFRPWMYQIARRARIDRFNSRRGEPPLPVNGADSDQASPCRDRPDWRLEQSEQAILQQEALG
jgi:RNA polymerase sigma-70 factor (ECF subfamily)